MLETLPYTRVPGQRTSPSITVYALSTCGFCKRAMSFLNANGFSYRYVYVDLIPLDVKNEAKKRLKELYKVDVAFPFLTLDDSSTLVGFIETDWRKALGV